MFVDGVADVEIVLAGVDLVHQHVVGVLKRASLHEIGIRR